MGCPILHSAQGSPSCDVIPLLRSLVRLKLYDIVLQDMSSALNCARQCQMLWCLSSWSVPRMMRPTLLRGSAMAAMTLSGVLKCSPCHCASACFLSLLSPFCSHPHPSPYPSPHPYPTLPSSPPSSYLHLSPVAFTFCAALITMA